MSEYDHRVHLKDLPVSRKELLSRMGNGFAGLSLASLLTAEAHADTAKTASNERSLNPLAVKAPPLPAKAKRVIFFFFNGGISHVDSWDPKPNLTKYHGQPLPYANLPTERKTGTCFRSPFTFKKRGQSGVEVSDLFDNISKHIDDIAVIRSMHADVPSHEISLLLMNCGDGRLVRPAFGSWMTYALGSENQNLPGFIAMCPHGYPIQDTQNWQSGFLPGIFQGTYVDPSHTDMQKLIENIKNNVQGLDEQKEQIDLLQKLNHQHLATHQHDAQLEARIQSYELAARMQVEATDAFDVDKEPSSIREMYGKGVYARQCIIARRLLERGVRFIQLYHGAGQPWDNHDDIEVNHKKLAVECDQAISAFMTDLKQRGMFQDTLIIGSGEFGRTPTVELPTPGANAGKTNGRDHNHHGFSTWIAGGGVKGGQAYGATDDFGFRAEQNPVHVHDLHATLLKMLGFDHTKLTYRYAGRDFRLTDLYGNVVKELLA